MNPTDIAAWVGAATGTAALLLEVWQWRESRPHVEISTNPNMHPVPPGPLFPDAPHLFVTVTNTGGARTTITHLSLEYYPGWLARIRRKGEWGVVMNQYPRPLPHALEPGDRWETLVAQCDPVVKARATGLLYCNVSHTMSPKPARKRVHFKK